MFEISEVILLHIFLCFEMCESQTICEPITQESNGKNITWDIHLKDNLYRSSPLCLDGNFKIIERTCEEDNWSDEPECSSLQEELSPCPDDFYYYQKKDICYMIVKNQHFPPVCPYNNVMGFFDYLELFAVGLVKGPVWFPAKTLQDYGIGNMVIIEPTKYYGDIVSVSVFWKETFNKQCLTYEAQSNFQPVYCNASYDFVCAYKPLKIRLDNVCSRKLKKECAPSDFTYTEKSCFCRQEETCDNVTFAQFQKPYQNILISNCNFGLYQNDGKMIWANTQEEITYSNWNQNVNFQNSFGVILEDGTWGLQEEKSSSCSVCQNNIVYNKPRITLKLNKDKKRLVLTVDYIEDLHIPEGREVPMFCFSDTNSYIDTFSMDLFDDYEVINESRILYYFKYSQSCPGFYWCEAFQLPMFNKLKTEKVLVFDEEYYGNEYAAILVLDFDAAEDILPIMREKLLSEVAKRNDPFYLRWLTTLVIDEEVMAAEFLVHVTSKTFTDVEIEYYEFYEKLKIRISNISNYMRIVDFRSVSYCLPDETVSQNLQLHWFLTKVNVTATPDEFCLQEDGTPVTRACTGDFLYGAMWSAVNGSCSEDPVISPITESLYDLLHTNETTDNKITDLVVMTGNFTNYLPVDIHYIAEIIDKTDKHKVLYLEELTKIMDNVVSTHKETLKTSQDLLNSTDKLLYSFDVLVGNFYSKKRFYTETDIVTKNIMVYIFDTKISNTTGIGVYRSETGYIVKKLHKNTTYKDLLKEENLNAATYIPQKLLQQISENLAENQPLTVAITVFLNDYLFNEDHLETKQVIGNIFGILLPKIKNDFKVRIPIVYKSVGSVLDKQCSHWHYGSPNEFANIKGKWQLDDKPKEDDTGNVCFFDHTTHFALLIFSDFSDNGNKDLLNNYTYLNVITTLGCGLSIIGIVGILITAILFKPWRASKGNQILIHYSIMTLLQICLLYAASNIDHDENHLLCVILGASLHYDVLSQFCWMLVMAILHYKRFVLVFNQQHKWIILKSSIVGYLIPCIPVVINISISTDNYTVGTTGICYPTGGALYVWLLLPVGGIVLTNLLIFCVIIKNIFHKNIQSDYGQDYAFVLKLRLVIVLFSTLGITWVFGFAAEIFNSVLCTYLFCLTASLQGFIIFLAFIVFNATTRRMYWLFMKTMKLKMKLMRT